MATAKNFNRAFRSWLVLRKGIPQLLAWYLAGVVLMLMPIVVFFEKMGVVDETTVLPLWAQWMFWVQNLMFDITSMFSVWAFAAVLPIYVAVSYFVRGEPREWPLARLFRWLTFGGLPRIMATSGGALLGAHLVDVLGYQELGDNTLLKYSIAALLASFVVLLMAWRAGITISPKPPQAL